MSGRIVWLNGAFVPESQARFSIFDAGVLYGEFAFEMTRTFRGEPFHLPAHLERLYATLNYLGIDPRLDPGELEGLTRETLARNQATEPDDVDWHIRHDVSAGPAELYDVIFPEGARPTVCISCWPLVRGLGRLAEKYRSGVDLFFAVQRALPAEWVDPRAKTRSRVHFQLAQREAARRGKGEWPLLLDPSGNVAEGPSWNIFFVQQGRLLSPEPKNILNGVSRQITLDAARELKIPVDERPIDVSAALAAEEAFCTATSFGLLPVRSLEGRALPGAAAPADQPVYRTLLAAWQTICRHDFAAQADAYAVRLAEWERREREAR